MNKITLNKISGVDLRDKKISKKLMVTAFILLIVSGLIGNFIYPFAQLIDYLETMKRAAIFVLIFIGLSIIKVVLHEVIHAIMMKKYGANKIEFGYTSGSAYTKSDGYFNKRQFTLITLAPLIVLSILLIPTSLVVPRDMFWLIWLVQIMNMAGASGDLYVMFIIKKLPSDAIIRDNGPCMDVYQEMTCEDRYQFKKGGR